MDQNPQQPSSEAPPASTPGQPAPGMPPTTNYPRTMGVSQDDKSQAMLMWILSIPFPLIVPLIFFLIGKDKPFVYRHAAMGLTVGIALFVLYFLSGILIFILIGILMYFAVAIFHLIVGIMGAVAANKGEEYDPPMIAGLAKSMFKV